MKNQKLYFLVHWMAIILGLFVILFFLTIIESTALSSLIFDEKWGVLPFTLMLLVPIVGYFVSLQRPKSGGLCMILGGMILVVYLLIIGSEGVGRMAFVFALPFIIPGLLFWLSQKLKTN